MTEQRSDYLTRFQSQPDSLATKPISVFLPKEVDQLVRSLPNRSEWLRRVITAAAEQELVSEAQQAT